MGAKTLEIKETELNKACEYISRQFAAHSWWPGEQPREAQREYMLMNSSAISLNIWCKKWLDTGQFQKLINSIHTSF